MWICSVRSKKMRCPATVLQTRGDFQMGQIQHIHPADPRLPLRVKVSAEVIKLVNFNKLVNCNKLVIYNKLVNYNKLLN